MVTQTNTNSNLSLIERAKLARVVKQNDADDLAASTLRAACEQMLKLDKGEGVLRWCERAGQHVPYLEVDGLQFAYYSDNPLGLYVGVTCCECGGPARAIIHDLAELADVHEYHQHRCGKCAQSHQDSEGGW